MARPRILFARIVATLREATWLDRRRVRGYALVLALVQLVAAGAWLLASSHGVDPAGKTIGTDFTSFWAAARLATDGHPWLAYAPGTHRLVEAAITPDAAPRYYAFFYPPPFLLILLPLGLLPYFAALAAWLGVTGAAFFAVLRRLLPPLAPGDLLLCLAFPAVLLTLGHGQNAFLTTALFGGGLLLLDRRPGFAGMVLGLLVVKPHLAVLLPFALALRGNWRSFVASGASALLVALASLAVLGPASWHAFLASAPAARAALDQQLVGPEKMVSIFAACQLLGASALLATAVQALAALVSLALLARLSRTGASTLSWGGALVAATLLSSPFLLDYDLMLLAVPLAILFRHGMSDAFLPFAKIVLLAGVLCPLVARSLAGAVSLPIAPLVAAAVLAALARRAGATGGATNPRLPRAPLAIA